MARLTIAPAVLVFMCSLSAANAADVNCQDVHAAVFMDEPVELQQLIAHGADMECRDAINQTPLITATDGASIQSFSILLTRGVNIHARDEIGQTALDKAREKLAFFDMKGGETYRRLYQQMIKMLVASEAAR
ncbi:MAG TPA: ankyrin repeat domain-containing protein [Rhodospirillales bacterium]|nr:ankyrin repeat domain-containing protein [Rhodospirillales bacterium]